MWDKAGISFYSYPAYHYDHYEESELPARQNENNLMARQINI
jgi:hypothetical protein